jgi:hypothetical protein
MPKIAIALAAFAVVLAWMAYMVAQWRVADPLSVQVIGVTRDEEGYPTLRLEIKNASFFPIRLRDWGGIEPLPLKLLDEGEPIDYYWSNGEPINVILLKGGQTIQRDLTGREEKTFDGVFHYDWEPTSLETLRRIEAHFEKWTPWKAVAPEYLEMRSSTTGPVSVPMPAGPKPQPVGR